MKRYKGDGADKVMKSRFQDEQAGRFDKSVVLYILMGALFGSVVVFVLAAFLTG